MSGPSAQMRREAAADGSAPAVVPVPQTLHAVPRAVRVMHVVSALHPGGMEYGVVKLVNGLDRRAVSSSICSTRPAAPSLKAKVSPDVPVFELRRRDGNDPRLVWELLKLFRREKPDVVHTHA